MEIMTDHIKQVINDMQTVDEYKITKNSALESAAVSAPILTKIAVAVNACLGGSLGTRSTRKQLQAVFHHTCGNMEMVVKKN